MQIGEPDPATLAAALARTFSGPVTIAALRRVSGGASRETWLFDATDEAGCCYPLVLRRDAGGHSGWSTRATEYAVLAAAGAAGVPVPPLRLLLEPADGLGDGFVMDRIDGETIPRRILRDDDFAKTRGQLTAECGTLAAQVHAVPLASLPDLPVLEAATQVEQNRATLDAFASPRPTFELAFRWLRERLPAHAPAHTLVHGDFRLGNLMVGPEGVRALLDWELAHVGDPAEDLGWLCVAAWRFGQFDRVVGGFGDLDELLDAYSRVRGSAPEPEAVRFWTALGTLKWGVMALMQASTHLSGIARSVELAVIGRRVVETEHDLLVLMDGGW